MSECESGWECVGGTGAKTAVAALPSPAVGVLQWTSFRFG